jgi:hypothetical protein
MHHRELIEEGDKNRLDKRVLVRAKFFFKVARFIVANPHFSINSQ